MIRKATDILVNDGMQAFSLRDKNTFINNLTSCYNFQPNGKTYFCDGIDCWYLDPAGDRLEAITKMCVKRLDTIEAIGKQCVLQ
ncbi:MAG: hypothetical protein LBM67_08470 [Lentimicrobiaceae bacterium]|jgi:hypothetical protein|nr:hypothetical protein [Lentimicrobiaceae bacterium]